MDDSKLFIVVCKFNELTIIHPTHHTFPLSTFLVYFSLVSSDMHIDVVLLLCRNVVMLISLSNIYRDICYSELLISTLSTLMCVFVNHML